MPRFSPTTEPAVVSYLLWGVSLWLGARGCAMTVLVGMDETMPRGGAGLATWALGPDVPLASSLLMLQQIYSKCSEAERNSHSMW